MSRTGVVLFTRDLRIHDHPALAAARRECDQVVPLFVLDDRLLTSAKRTAFLHECLDALRSSIDLTVRRGDVVEQVASFEPNAVYLSSDVSPYARRRERRLRERFDVRALPGITIVPPGAVTPAGAAAYRVFSPYWRAWRGAGIPAAVGSGRSLGTVDLSSYERLRNDLGADATTRLSPRLHLGAVSPAEVARRAEQAGAEELLRQLCWRDFFAQLLAAFPRLGSEDLRPPRRPWVDDLEAVEAWKQGRTGYPLVDAAMRQLLAEGWIPNRARMVAASFLTKQLGIDWRAGAAHFMEHLVDGDLASNAGNWQWVAGTGTDSRPNRFFNPALQGRRYDPDGEYVRRHVPELGPLPAERIHDPTAADRRELGYPEPVVDHAAAVARLRG